MDLQARIGRRLAQLREERGLSSYELAKAIGVTRQFIDRLESGERAPSLKVMEGLASALRVDAAALLQFEAGGAHPSKKESLSLVQLQGAARRLPEDDLKLVLTLARRLGRRG